MKILITGCRGQLGTELAKQISTMDSPLGKIPAEYAGAEVVGVMLSVLLPEGTEEEELRQMMQQAEEVCADLNIETVGGHTEVTNVVNQPVITATGIGKVKKDKIVTTSGARPGDDVVVTKWIGLEGTSIIAKEREEELKKRLSP